jgi:hypothetical protein
LAYLRERSGTIASITLRKDAMGIRRWHQADVLPDPTDDEALVEFSLCSANLGRPRPSSTALQALRKCRSSYTT